MSSECLNQPIKQTGWLEVNDYDALSFCNTASREKRFALMVIAEWVLYSLAKQAII
jgi:hypothetical protein